MPRAYSDQERAYIRQRLHEEAILCIKQYGMRKTSVDELVRRVNIPKGTFYLFYPSKEMLFFEVMMDFHDNVQEEVLKAVGALKDNVTPDTLTDLLFRFCKMADDSILMPMIVSGDRSRRHPSDNRQADFPQKPGSAEGVYGQGNPGGYSKRTVQ